MAQEAEASVNDVYREYLKNETELDQLDEELSQPNRRKVPGDSHASQFDDTMSVDLHLLTGHRGYKKQKRQSQLQEYFEAIAVDLRNDDPEYQRLLNDPWQWWLQQGQHKYPVVFKMACDFLSIPSTSYECERCFSSARRTITDDRNRFGPSTIEAVQVQKNWLRHKLVDSPLGELEDLIQRTEKRQANMTPERSLEGQFT